MGQMTADSAKAAKARNEKIVNFIFCFLALLDFESSRVFWLVVDLSSPRRFIDGAELEISRLSDDVLTSPFYNFDTTNLLHRATQ